MRAHLTASRPVDVDPWPAIEQFLHDPAGWAPRPARPLDDDALLSVVHLGPLRHHVVLRVGAPWTLPDAVSRPISWTPSDEDGTPVHDRTLPGFEGRMTLRHAPGEIRVVVEGTYVPPGGALGAAADRLALNRAGEATVRALVDDVVERLLASVDTPTSDR